MDKIGLQRISDYQLSFILEWTMFGIEDGAGSKIPEDQKEINDIKIILEEEIKLRGYKDRRDFESRVWRQGSYLI